MKHVSKFLARHRSTYGVVGKDIKGRKDRMGKPRKSCDVKSYDVLGLVTGTKLVRVNEYDGSHYFIRVDK